MEDKTQILHKTLFDKGLYTKSLDEFSTQFGTPESRQKLHKALFDKGLYTKTAEEFDTQFFPEVKKKDLPVDSTELLQNPLETLTGQSKESVTPKLPFQAPPKKEVKKQDLLPSKLTPTSFISATSQKPDFIKQEYDKLIGTTNKELSEESDKLISDFKAKIETEGANKGELKKELTLRLRDLEIKKQKEAEKAIDDLLNNDSYDVLEKGDVKNIEKSLDDIIAKYPRFEDRDKAINEFKNNFSGRIKELFPEYGDMAEKELNDVIAKKTLLGSDGNISPYGWKKEASEKLSTINEAQQNAVTDFRKKYPDFEEKTTATPGGIARISGYSPSLDQNPEKRKQFYSDYEQYRKDLDLLGIAKEKLGNVMKLPDNERTFASEFSTGGRDLLAAVSSAGWSDVARALENTAIAIKKQKGEK